jgi:hypothetical protein
MKPGGSSKVGVLLVPHSLRPATLNLNPTRTRSDHPDCADRSNPMMLLTETPLDHLTFLARMSDVADPFS